MRRFHLVAGCPQKVNAVPVRPCRVRLRPRYMERASARRRCCCAACVCGRVARSRTAPGEKELSVRCCAAGPHQRSWSTFWLTSVESMSPTASVLLRGAIHGSRAKYPESGPPPALSCYRSDRSDDQEAVGRAAMSFIGDLGGHPAVTRGAAQEVRRHLDRRLGCARGDRQGVPVSRCSHGQQNCGSV
jgi:hypothetical protein